MPAEATVNVKVAVRCRPFNKKEGEKGAKVCVEVNAEAHSISIKNLKDPSEKPKNFTFDFAYYIESTQQQVYDDIGKPVIVQALDGYNGTIFAYGQTGSGKTHSMMGSGDDHGIIPKMNDELFGTLSKMSEDGTDRKSLVTVSYLEIYNEVIKDLLNPSDLQLKIRQHPDMGIYVQSLAELVVRSAEEVTKLIEQGNGVRKVAATQMNERSSRSHSCFTIKVEQKMVEEIGEVRKEKILKSKINLVDLAGSERASKTGATGDRLKEGAAINKSLSALGNVINHLAEGKKGHIPYRDSKLTRLLQESLGGNSKTIMVAAVSPADYNYDETLGTLLYAHRAKAIKNAAKRNEDVNEKMIRELREEIDALREQLKREAEGASGGGGGAVGDGEVPEEQQKKMEDMAEAIANLERAKQETWEEKERLAIQVQEERAKAMADENHIAKVMETVKEEKMEAIQRIKKLQQQKVKLARGMKKGKAEYGHLKTQLEDDMGKYQELIKEGGSRCVM
jgi:hypothetical protein